MRPSLRRTAQDAKLDYASRGVAITAFLAAVAYWPGFTEPGNTARWIVLSISLPLLFLVKQSCAAGTARSTLQVAGPGLAVPAERKNPLSLRERVGVRGVAVGLILCWLGDAALSLAWTPALPDGLAALWRLVLLALAGAIGARVADLTPTFIGFGLGIAVNSAMVLAQLGGLTWFEQAAAPAGLFVNKNMLAEASVLALAALAAGAAGRIGFAARATLIVTCMPAAVLTASKAAFMALILTACAWLGYRRRPWLALALALIVLDALLLWHSAWPIQTLTQRLGLWRDTLAGAAWFGHGLGSFDAVWPLLRTDDVLTSFHLRPGHPHADWVLLVSDLGIGAVFAGALAGLVLWPARAPEFPATLDAADVSEIQAGQRIEGRKEKRAGQLTFVCFIATGLAAFPLENPASLLMAGLAAGHVLGQLPRAAA